MPRISERMMTFAVRNYLWRETPCAHEFLDGKIYEFTEGKDYGNFANLKFCQRLFVKACGIKNLIPVIQFLPDGFLFQAVASEQWDKMQSTVPNDAWKLDVPTVCRADGPSEAVDEERGRVLLDHLASREAAKNKPPTRQQVVDCHKSARESGLPEPPEGWITE